MLIEKKNVAELLPADYNPRKDLKPGDKEYEKLKRSIEQFGYVEPVIWNATTSRVVGGHQRSSSTWASRKWNVSLLKWMKTKRKH